MAEGRGLLSPYTFIWLYVGSSEEQFDVPSYRGTDGFRIGESAAGLRR